MKVKQISLGYTYNLGNYESRRLDITFELDENDHPLELGGAFAQMQRELDEQNGRLRSRLGKHL